jgi:hypothetical protein
MIDKMVDKMVDKIGEISCFVLKESNITGCFV